MQLNLRLKLHKPLTLPLGYNHILQSAIYTLGSDCDGSNIHDGGYKFNNQDFKLFCFGLLEGRKRVANGRITFFEEVSFEVRSINDNWLNKVLMNAVEDGVRFGETYYRVASAHMSQKYILSNTIDVEMKSPIVARRTNGKKKSKYYTPFQEDFYDLIRSNFYNKYCSFYGEAPKEDFQIIPLKISKRDKAKPTNYKGIFWINAWGGRYRLSGSLDALNLLYNTGLGSANPKGFGMFEII